MKMINEQTEEIVLAKGSEEKWKENSQCTKGRHIWTIWNANKEEQLCLVVREGNEYFSVYVCMCMYVSLY